MIRAWYQIAWDVVRGRHPLDWFLECKKAYADAAKWQQCAIRLEAIVIEQQKKLKYYEVRADTMHNENLKRGQTNARLNKELQEANRKLKGRSDGAVAGD